MNFLEQLVGEWYEYQGYFVRKNIRFGRRKAGGWTGEIDVLAIYPERPGELTHIETSMDADSWSQRIQRFSRKCNDAKSHLEEILPIQFHIVRQVAVVLNNPSPATKDKLGDLPFEIKSIPDLIFEITKVLQNKDPLKETVPESFPILRALQFASNYGAHK
jgi:hypothetical protein